MDIVQGVLGLASGPTIHEEYLNEWHNFVGGKLPMNPRKMTRGESRDPSSPWILVLEKTNDQGFDVRPVLIMKCSAAERSGYCLHIATVQIRLERRHG